MTYLVMNYEFNITYSFYIAFLLNQPFTVVSSDHWGNVLGNVCFRDFVTNGKTYEIEINMVAFEIR